MRRNLDVNEIASLGSNVKLVIRKILPAHFLHD